MKFLLLSFVLFFAFVATAQVPSYYNNVNISATGNTLKNALYNKIRTGSTPSYSGVWNGLKQADLVTSGSSKVLLIYGFDDNDNNYKTDRTRSKNDNGGNQGDWNREHVYPKSLGNPNLGTSGPGADLHHMRAADVWRNSNRSSRKFAAGSGTSKTVGSTGWYPGDEFKGDVARMMMYMYVRYGSRCLPTNVGIGSVATDNMLNLFLQWNVEDPVSAFEDRRNDVIQGIQGNRNPFIDNPAFATQIWGGPQAEDRFGNGGGTGGGGSTGCTNDITVSIKFDNWPGDISWTIKNSSSQTVASGGNYSSGLSGQTVNVTNALADGSYVFEIKDSYSDGLCCNYGDGFYSVTNSTTGSVITLNNGGAFSTLTASFTISCGRFAPSTTTIEEVVAEEKEAWNVTLYPNPVQGQLHLKLDNPRALDYIITNQVGQVLATGRVQNQQIEVANLPKGMYLLTLNDGEERITKTFVKQ